MKSKSSMFSEFLSKNSNFILKLSYQFFNKITTQEDAYQDLLLRTLELIEENSNLPEKELGRFIRSSLSNYVVDQIRKSDIRNDSISRLNVQRNSERITLTKDYSFFTEENEQLLPQLIGKTQDDFTHSQSFEDEVSSNIILEQIRIEIQKYESLYPGIYTLFSELVSPSNEVTEKYIEYTKELARPRVSGFIPVSVLGNFFGLDKNYTRKLELKIREILQSKFSINPDSFELA